MEERKVKIGGHQKGEASEVLKSIYLSRVDERLCWLQAQSQI